MAFKDQVLNQQVLHDFAFMKGKLPVVHLAHSIGAFFGLSGIAMDVQGKQIAFVRDRNHCQQPIPFILPPQNLWTWAKVRYLANTAQYLEYNSHEANLDRLWAMGAGAEDLVDIQLSCLLSLPMVVAEFIVQQGGGCLPHTMQAFIMDQKLVLDWCMAASHAADDGKHSQLGGTRARLVSR